MRFFVGWHQPNNGVSGTRQFDYVFISIRRLWRRKSFFTVKQGWILDSGAFKELELHGDYSFSTEQYAQAIKFWAQDPKFEAAVSQDFMCENYIFERRLLLTGTRYTIADHQRLTIEHYDVLRSLLPETISLIPVLQGYRAEEYLSHIDQYGERLKLGMRVGIGSLCKRQNKPRIIEDLLIAIKQKRPDLKLHGFGVKKATLSTGLVWELLDSADSQAHNFSRVGAKQYEKAVNSPTTALKYYIAIQRDRPKEIQLNLFWRGAG